MAFVTDQPQELRPSYPTTHHPKNETCKLLWRLLELLWCGCGVESCVGEVGAMAHRRAVMTLYRRSLIHARSWAINTVRMIVSSHYLHLPLLTSLLQHAGRKRSCLSFGLACPAVCTFCCRWTRHPCSLSLPDTLSACRACFIADSLVGQPCRRWSHLLVGTQTFEHCLPSLSKGSELVHPCACGCVPYTILQALPPILRITLRSSVWHRSRVKRTSCRFAAFVWHRSCIGTGGAKSEIVLKRTR